MANNKKFLLDTQIFIWWMKDEKLTENITNILSDPTNIIYLSTVSVWEMIIKEKIGKLKLPKNWKITIKDGRFEILPISLEHVLVVETLPLHHKDPFDRMLIAQSQTENLTLITSDLKMNKYKIQIIKYSV